MAALEGWGYTRLGMGRWASGVLALCVLGSDQLAKWVVGTHLALGESVPIIGDVVRLTRVHNTGGAFGLLPEHGGLFLGVAAAVSLAGAFALISRRMNGSTRIGLTIFWAGTVGNLVDRLRWGYVLDFVELPYWPVFNIADAAIVVGAGLLCWRLLRGRT